MLKLWQRKWFRYIVVSMLFLLGSAGLLLFCILYSYRDKLAVSEESGVCEDGTAVELQIFRKGQIYYTVNGGKTQEYQEPIVLSAGQHGSWYNIETFCVFEDGSQTQPQD